MRIGLSTSVLQRGKSGVGQYVLALVRALVAQPGEHEFVLFVLEEDLPHFSFARDAMRIVPVAEAHRPAVKNILWHQRELPRLARALQLDVLHVPSYRRMVWPRPCTLVATIHDLAPFRFPGKYDLLRMFYGRTVVRRLAHQQDRIIAVSHETAGDIRRFFEVPASRVTVVHNGIDHTRFSVDAHDAARDEIARRHGVEGPFFLYVSRLEHPAKNHVRLIEAFNRFKAVSPSPWKLVLCGSDWHGAAAIHETAARSPFAADILLPGFVPDADLPNWYRAATVTVYPSLFEGFGFPPLEAMACGSPVLASSIGAVNEVCAGAAATANPLDVEDLTHQLLRLARDEDFRAQLRATGLQWVRQFDWARTAAGTLSVYERAHRSRVPSSNCHYPNATNHIYPSPALAPTADSTPRTPFAGVHNR